MFKRLINIKHFCKTTDLIKQEINHLQISNLSKLEIKYNENIDQHYKELMPFTDNKLYTELFYYSSGIPDSKGLQSWDIIYEYIKYNIDLLDKDFLIDTIQQYSKIKYYNFEYWYHVEKRIIKDMPECSNAQIASIVYSFGYTSQGTKYLFTKLSEEVLNRGIRYFTQEEFIMLYNGFKNGRLRDKMLWAILEKAKEELYPDILII